MPRGGRPASIGGEPRGCRGGNRPEPRRGGGFPCAAGHGGLRGAVVAVMGCAGEELLEQVEALLSPPFACPSCQPHPAMELTQGGGDHQVRSASG